MNQFKKYLLAFIGITYGVCVTAQEQQIPAKQIELNIHLAPASTHIKSATYGNEEKVGGGLIGGVDISYYFYSKGKIKIGLSAGINYSSYKTSRNLNYNDSLWTTDADNDQVHLFEKGDNLEETQKISFIDIPVLIRFTYAISPKLDLYLNSGPYFSIIAGKSYNSSLIYTAKGYYPKYNALIYNVDVDGSPYFYPTQKSLSDEGGLQLKNNIGMEIGVGIKYRLNPEYAFTIGVCSNIGLKNLSNYKGEETSLINSDRTINSVMKRLDKISAKAFGLELGFAINL